MWSGGIRMSTIATSGLWARTLRSSSSASPAWPTTSIPASSSRRAAPSRSSTESSRDHDAHGISARRIVPAAGRAGDLELAAERRDAVGEAAQAAALRVGAAAGRRR